MNAPLRPKRKASNMIVWGILGLLAISLTGFGVRSVGRGRTQAIATVGGEKVTVGTYASALRAQLRALSQRVGRNVTLEQARTFGLDKQVLAQVLASAALDAEDSRLGLSVGDKRVLDNLLATRAFQGLNGKFNKATYEGALKQSNLKPAAYDIIVRKNSARSILQSGISGGIKADGTYARLLLDYVGETRSFDWAHVTKDMLDSPTRAPTEAEIAAYYKAHPKLYTSLETRKITYDLLTPDMLIPSLKPDETALKQLYDSQPGRFHIPARRVVDRLVFGTEKEAKAARAKIDSGTKTFADIVKARGLSLKDVDMGKVTHDTLSGAAADAVFALTQPGVVGPVDSALGPALFRVNAVLAAQNTSFADARKILAPELLADQARKQIDDQFASISDSLAGGVVLEDIAKETAMTLGKIDYTTASKDKITKYPEFRKAAEQATLKDYAQVTPLSDGGIFAMRLDKIVPPALIPLADVRDRVIADWSRDETQKRVAALAAKLAGQIKAGSSFTDAGLTPIATKDIRRQGALKGAPRGLLDTVFKTAKQDVATLDTPQNVVVLQVTAITPFDPKKPENATALKNLNRQYSQEVGADVFDSFARAVEENAGITINQALINAVHAQMP